MIKIGTDKILHATVLGVPPYLVFLYFLDVYWAAGLTVLLGYGKEVADRTGLSQWIVNKLKIKLVVQKKFSYGDFIATIIIPLIISAIKVYYDTW